MVLIYMFKRQKVHSTDHGEVLCVIKLRYKNLYKSFKNNNFAALFCILISD